MGYPAHAPFDRVIVTVSPWDIPSYWYEQVNEGGMVVAPLRWRGQTRSVAFRRHGDRLTAESSMVCGFVPMIGDSGESSVGLDEEGRVELFFDDDQGIQPERIRGVLKGPGRSIWSGVHIDGQSPFDGIWLRMSAQSPGLCSPQRCGGSYCAEYVSADSGAAVPGSGQGRLGCLPVDQASGPAPCRQTYRTRGDRLRSRRRIAGARHMCIHW